ncbi:MAG: hypothetical protein IJ437_06370 [Clostridia bacterium]|nr:hypothetical protein [Clostridia bacterium]
MNDIQNLQQTSISQDESDDECYIIGDDSLSDEDYHDNENYPILKTRKSLFALLSFCCGFIAVLLCCISFGADVFLPLISFLSGGLQIILAITGIVFFVIDIIKNKAPNGLAYAGLISSMLSIVLAILQITYAIIVATSFVVSVLVHAF